MFRKLQFPFPSSKKGVPQGSILAPLLFSIFINDLGFGVDSATIHLYADNTIIYTVASSLNQALLNLHHAFNVIQHSLSQLKLKLKKDKIYDFQSYSFQDNGCGNISTFYGTTNERVCSYKCLGTVYGQMEKLLLMYTLIIC